MPNQSGINDEELNKMIASLQQEQRGSSIPVAPAGQVVVQPIESQPATSVIGGIPGNMTTVSANETSPLNQPAPMAPEITTPNVSNEISNQQSTDGLDDIKRQAINELRPLVDKLDLPAEEKFDTLLLLIRTTDDSSLIPAAHDTAKAITDDSRRAQALLDVIKEIDFFGNKK